MNQAILPDDIEDALQYFTGIHHHITVFISRDKRFKKAAISSLPIYTPEEFVRKFLSQKEEGASQIVVL